jgi:2-oxo-3-hexenedioate decarboxylase
MWGYPHNRTVHDLPPGGVDVALTALAEPRIEPEIIFAARAVTAACISAGTPIERIEWVAHGFKIVQSIFAGWRFCAPDTIAAYGLHGALSIGRPHLVASRPDERLREIARFGVDLFRNGGLVDHGHAANVLNGPLFAPRRLVELLVVDPLNAPLEKG